MSTMNFDFRMDKASWGMLVFMFLTFVYFMYLGTGGESLEPMGYVRMILFPLLLTFVLVALACIPVVIVCYFIKRIPDIDYSIWVATAFTVIGIISEQF